MHTHCIKTMVTSIRIEQRTMVTVQASNCVLIIELATFKVAQIIKLNYIISYTLVLCDY